MLTNEAWRVQFRRIRYSVLKFVLLFLVVGVITEPGEALLVDTDGVVPITWFKSASPEVVGYNVYRGHRATGPFKRVNPHVVVALKYFDADVYDGQTYFYVVTAVNSQGVESVFSEPTGKVAIQLDTAGPVVFAYAPTDGQGFREDANGNGQLDAGEDLNGNGTLDRDRSIGRRIPGHTGLYVRIWDDGGLDPETFGVTLVAGGETIPGSTSAYPVSTDDNTGYYIVFTPSVPLPLDAMVTVAVEAADMWGNGMETHVFAFQIESRTMHEAAVAAAPETETVEVEPGVLLLTGADAEIRFSPATTRHVALAPTDEFPALPVETPAAAFVHLEGVQYYGSPIQVRIPLSPALASQGPRFEVLRLSEDPAIGWQPAAEGDGWLISRSVAPAGTPDVGGYMDVRVTHSAAIAVIPGS